MEAADGATSIGCLGSFGIGGCGIDQMGSLVAWSCKRGDSKENVAGCWEGGSGESASGGDFVVRFRFVEGVRETTREELAIVEHVDMVVPGSLWWWSSSGI